MSVEIISRTFLKQAARSVGELVVRVIVVLTFVFFVLRVLPFDPALSIAGLSGDPQTIDRIREHLELDRSLAGQYIGFFNNIVRLDLGQSYVFGDQVAQRIAAPLTITLSLALFAVALSLLFSHLLMIKIVPRGVGRKTGVAIGALGLFLTSVPTFIIGIGSLLIFSLGLKVYPLTGMPEHGYARFIYFVLPAIILAIPGIVGMGRVIITHVEEMRESEWFVSLRTLGLSPQPGGPLFSYARLSLKRVIASYTSNLLIYTFNGAIVIELIFSIPGGGQQLYRALLRGDYPMVEGIVLSAVVVFTIANWLTDIIAPITQTDQELLS